MMWNRRAEGRQPRTRHSAAQGRPAPPDGSGAFPCAHCYGRFRKFGGIPGRERYGDNGEYKEKSSQESSHCSAGQLISYDSLLSWLYNRTAPRAMESRN